MPPAATERRSPGLPWEPKNAGGARWGPKPPSGLTVAKAKDVIPSDCVPASAFRLAESSRNQCSRANSLAPLSALDPAWSIGLGRFWRARYPRSDSPPNQVAGGLTGTHQHLLRHGRASFRLSTSILLHSAGSPGSRGVGAGSIRSARDKANCIRKLGSRGRFSSQTLEPSPFRWNRNGALDSWFDAFSLREPVSTSLENALAPHSESMDI